MTREHIISEIRRTAEANGGVPLGAKRFFNETGIKPSDWFGRYWSRWGEALSDAGYEPNPLQGAFTDEHLIEAIAGLARELGRFPNEGEIRLQRRRDATFPSHNAFRRFGSKPQFVARVREYCRVHPHFADVEALCPPAPPAQPESGERERDEMHGFVYLLKGGKHYKIGKTNAAGRRERELAIQLPEKAQTVHVIRTDDPAGIEAYWHRRFEAKRKHGEWFELDAADVRAFKRRKFM